jgi:quinoprotein relay system zinc metallohydrolase 2
MALQVTLKLLCCMAAQMAWAAAWAMPPLAVQQVADGVYVQVGAHQAWGPANAGNVSNVGFVVGARCVAVIDSGGSPEVGQALRAAVAGVTPLPVCLVVTTHAHPDHILGHAAFVSPISVTGLAAGQAETAPVVQFAAHAKGVAALGGRERYYRAAVQREFGQALPAQAIVYPTLPVASELEFDLGDRQLVLKAWPTAHTDNDLTVYDRQTRTLFLGDLLFVGHIPVVDGRLSGWLAVIEELKKLDVVLAVPGHGATSREWPGVMTAQTDYLQALRLQTKAAIRGKLNLSQAVEKISLQSLSNNPSKTPTWLLADLFHRRNVTAAFAELEWED